MDVKGFYQGQIFDAYEYLGAHVTEKGVLFRTFAPHAVRIALIGDFNNWQEYEMGRIYDGNFFEYYVEGATEGMLYKYRIYQQDGRAVDHCDPYGFGMELRPNSASVVRDLSAYQFQDLEWMNKRTDCKQKPLNIYELHFGSWKKKNVHNSQWLSYKEVGHLLIPYLKKNGYNYIEIMPLNEHPCDESWGYQSTGFYSPTSRYGSATELMEFIDLCHQNDIGVLTDFVPVHFAVDEYALANYDGTALYEYPNTDVGMSEWGSCNFMHSRGEVRTFLQSAARYWLKEYHFDGIRMDAISNIIYWQGNPNRGVNKNAVEFIKYMNQGLKQQFPTAILSAEDCTTYPKVTKPVEDGGLGFDYKWDMGWMNDTLNYFRTHPYDRMRDYHKLTFSMMYYYSEDFLLPLSHDEVVHGKATIVQKMNGDYEGKFPQARALYLYMFTHPGKKLNFMGNELGQLREWDEKRAQDWELLDYPIHEQFHRYMMDLNKLYLETPALYEWDYKPEGFQWVDCNLEEKCVYAFERRTKDMRVLCIFNFSDHIQEYRKEKLPDVRKIKLLLCSDMEKYGGFHKYSRRMTKLTGEFVISLQPFTGMIYLLD